MIEQLEICCCGITLSNKTLVKIMGANGAGTYLKEMEIYYNEWKTATFSNKNFKLGEVNELLREAG